MDLRLDFKSSLKSRGQLLEEEFGKEKETEKKTERSLKEKESNTLREFSFEAESSDAWRGFRIKTGNSIPAKGLSLHYAKVEKRG